MAISRGPRGSRPVASILLLWLIGGLLACGEPDHAKPAKKRTPTTLLVETVAATKEEVSTSHLRPGTLHYRHLLRVHNQEEGRILALPWFEGDRVSKGELLVQLDNELLHSELAKARADHSFNRQRLTRLESLQKVKAASQDEVAEAQAQLEVSLAELAILETRLGYSRIHAPFGGIVTRRLAEPGDVKPRHSHLLTLADPESLVARVDVSERLLPDLAVGNPVLLAIDALGPGTWTGKILRIFPTLDPLTHLTTVEITLDSPPAGARAGQFVRVTFTTPPRERLLIPFPALRRDRRGEHVFVVTDEKAQRRVVRSGRRIGNRVEILEGLQAGQQVITRGFMGLKEGVEVKTRSQ